MLLNVKCYILNVKLKQLKLIDLSYNTKQCNA